MSPASAAVKSTPSDAATLPVLVVCFLLSGCAALVYQIVWTREFALVFGTSELAVATVLAAYMGGLALGAWLVERWLPRISRPVRVYAALELGIAVGAVLLVPALLLASRTLLAAWFGGQDSPPSSEHVAISAFYLASAFVALAIPTTLMGATLPLLARHAVQEQGQIGRRIGFLYAANTAGAVAGALATAFVLLPALGLRRSVWVGATLNLLVFLLAAWLVRRERDAGRGAPGSGHHEHAPIRFAIGAPPGPGWVLPLMLLAGAISFMHEVLWTRMLAQIVGSSIYAFGVMVGSFLAGIALGGAAGALLARDRERSIDALAAALLAAGVWAAIAFLLLDARVPEQAGLSRNLFLGFLLLLPLTFAIGLTYPLAVRILADRPEEAAPASARVYAWNTVGGIGGSLAAGFFVIPALRYEGTIRLVALGSAVLAVLALLLLARRRAWFAAAAATVLLAGAVLFRPGPPERLLLASPLSVSRGGQILHYDVGRSASVVLLQQDGGLVLRTNGLPEALMDTPGMPPRFSGEFWMSSLAALAAPEARDMLIVGFGGGVVVEGVPPTMQRIDVIELEPKVIAANEATRARRKFDPLGDPRVRVVTNDARGALSLTSRRYGAIVSQPSHPWTAGASHLYTREFMALASSRLADGGVFVQWMNVAFLDEALLRSLTATLLDVFGHVRIYRPDPSTLVFLAARQPLLTEQRLAARGGAPLSVYPAHFGRFGINALEDLVTALAVDEDGARALAAGAPLITDDGNRMATSSVLELGRGLSADAAGRVLAPYDPLQRGAPWIFQGDFARQLDFAYIGRRQMFFRLIDPSGVDRIRRMVPHVEDAAVARFLQAMLIASAGDGARARQLTLEASAADPGNALLGFAYLQGAIGQIARGELDEDLRARVARLPAAAQATLQGARLLTEGRLQELAALDGLLASARWTDPWHLDAVLLRAEWRSRVATPELRGRLADQAISLVDRAVVVQPSLPMFAVRARAALAADRPDVLLESVASVVQWTFAQGIPPAGPPRERALRSLEDLRRILATTTLEQRVDATRLAEVRGRIAEAMGRLQ
jgi:spermidine synthase